MELAGFGLQAELSRLWSGFWWALLSDGRRWSDWETVAGGVRRLSGCRRSEFAARAY